MKFNEHKERENLFKHRFNQVMVSFTICSKWNDNNRKLHTSNTYTTLNEIRFKNHNIASKQKSNKYTISKAMMLKNAHTHAQIQAQFTHCSVYIAIHLSPKCIRWKSQITREKRKKEQLQKPILSSTGAHRNISTQIKIYL